MDKLHRFHFKLGCCKVSILHLALAWILGLISGVLFSVPASKFLLPTMRAALNGCVSISGLLTAIVLPFLFSAIAVYISRLWLLIPIAYVKAFSFSYLSVGILTAFGSAGWLIRWLLMFSDGLLLVPLWWYWFRHISGQKRFSLISLSGIAGIAVLIGSLDYCIISPFLADILKM